MSRVDGCGGLRVLGLGALASSPSQSKQQSRGQRSFPGRTCNAENRGIPKQELRRGVRGVRGEGHS